MPFSPRLGVPPSNHTHALQDVYDAINALPNFSLFSFVTPESNVTAEVPTLGFNYASGASRLWAKIAGSSNTGWVSIA